MEYCIRFEYSMLWWSIVGIFCALLLAKKWAPHAFYQFPLADTLGHLKTFNAPTHKRFFLLLRALILALLVIIIGRPQLVDKRSNIRMEGIDIVLALDVSGSMQYQDYDDDQRSRLEVAKEEAIRFVNKRTQDAIGLVLFGQDAISRIPLTLDKKSINHTLNELHLGIINPDGTVLSTAILTALNRLKKSQAKSKVIILLTDGEPTPNDADPALAIEMAQKMRVKIYTIGIGSDENKMLLHPLFGMVSKPKVNRQLLTHIAQETGGKFFLAHNSREMRTIYESIDALEKTTYDSPAYSTYYDIFVPLVWSSILLLLLELALSATIWFGV